LVSRVIANAMTETNPEHCRKEADDCFAMVRTVVLKIVAHVDAMSEQTLSVSVTANGRKQGE